jgi:hypothetical protein
MESIENVLDKNRIIAEFMGHKLNSCNEFDIEYTTIQGSWDTCPADDLEYHLSWDWLMPVIEKIEKDNHGYYFKIYGNQAFVQVHIMGDNSILTSQKYVRGVDYDGENTKLANAYMAVVEFINYYNNKIKESEQ